MKQLLIIGCLVCAFSGCSENRNAESDLLWRMVYPHNSNGFVVLFDEPKVAVLFEGIRNSGNGETVQILVGGKARGGDMQRSEGILAAYSYLDGVGRFSVNEFGFQIVDNGGVFIFGDDRRIVTPGERMVFIVNKDNKLRVPTEGEESTLQSRLFSEKNESGTGK
jgi:hypothetical protein